MKSLFEENNYNEIINRLSLLNKDTKPTWGKMSVGQIAWHCQGPLQIAIENVDYKKAPNLLAKWFIKKAMYSDSPLRKNLPTAPKLKAVEPKNFEEEIVVLKQLVTNFHVLKTRDNWNPHPLFGEFTHEQWGKMQYKHLDHHLRQFGV